MGQPPGEDEFYASILRSLPYSFEPYISALNTTSSVLGTVLSPNKLMQAFTDKYDRRNIGKKPQNEENTAFFAETGRKGAMGEIPKRVASTVANPVTGRKIAGRKVVERKVRSRIG